MDCYPCFIPEQTTDLLYTKDYGNITKLPSPESLKGKILLKVCIEGIKFLTHLVYQAKSLIQIVKKKRINVFL